MGARIRKSDVVFEPENACGMSATVFSMAERKGRFDGLSCVEKSICGVNCPASKCRRSSAMLSARPEHHFRSSALSARGWS